MLRLLKLLAYGLLGYAIYEFVRGMSQAEGGGGMSMGGSGMGGGASRGLEAGGGQGGGSRPQNITGPGAGMDVETNDADGGISTHRVGRGVVR